VLTSELVDTAVEYILHERQAIEPWRVAIELNKFASSVCDFPKATPEQWTKAIDQAVKDRRLERVGTKVRYLAPTKEVVDTQMELF
jgi:gamma-glutamylcysteine synthetase